MASGDMVNTMLNYGYSLLEAECLRVINSVCLDAHVVFCMKWHQAKTV